VLRRFCKTGCSRERNDCGLAAFPWSKFFHSSMPKRIRDRLQPLLPGRATLMHRSGLHRTLSRPPRAEFAHISASRQTAPAALANVVRCSPVLPDYDIPGVDLTGWQQPGFAVD
jgi:hypothetical protein